MCRVALAALIGLTAAVAASAAMAEDDFVWRRVDVGAGRILWVAAEDIYGFEGPRGDTRSAHVLWTHPAQPNLPGRTRYVISEYTFDCAAGGVHEDIWPFDASGEPLEEMADTPEREIDRRSTVGAVYQLACEGLDHPDDMELGSAREVLDYEASDRGAPPPARPPNRWNQGPGQPDDEPVEPSDSDREPSGGH